MKNTEFSRLAVAKRFLEFLNSDEVIQLTVYGRYGITTITDVAFPESDDDIDSFEPEFNKKAEAVQALSDYGKGNPWKALNEVARSIEEVTENFSKEEFQRYQAYVMGSPVNTANYLLHIKAESFLKNWLVEATGEKNLNQIRITKDNIETVKNYFENIVK